MELSISDQVGKCVFLSLNFKVSLGQEELT